MLQPRHPHQPIVISSPLVRRPCGRTLFALGTLLGSQWLPLLPAIAAPAPAGSVIENQATGSFVDATDNKTYAIESNIVTVSVAEIAGISATASGNSGLFLTGNSAYFDFTIQNEGNDATQFFLPDAPSAISGATAGTPQVVAYDADGSGATASVDLTANNLTVGTGGVATGTLFGSIPGLNGGFIPAGGTITLRIPVTVTATNGQTVSVTLGNTEGRTPTQNLVYQASSKDLYTTEDFTATGNGEVLGAPINGDATTHRQEASATQSVTIATLPTVVKRTSTANVVAGNTATYTITLSNPSSNGAISNVSIQDTLPSGFLYQSTATPVLSGGATRTTTTNPATGSVVLSWGTFSIPAGGQVALTFTASVDANTVPRTYQNGVTVNYTNSLGQAQTTTYNPSTSIQEDVTVTSTTFVPSPTPPSVSLGNACATPGQDGTQTLSGTINTYYPGVVSASAGSTTLSLGTPTGATTPIAAGDLLLIVQMQDATISATNSPQYGSGNTANAGRGQSDTASAGIYEYAIAKTAISGSSVTLVSPLKQSFTHADATGTAGQKRFQVVRVPQYSNATLSGAVTALPWNGQTGGIVALDVADTLTFSGGKIVATGTGFRGAGGRNSTGSGTVSTAANQDYVSLSTNAYHGSKGEGIAGTPKLTRATITIDASGGVTAGNSILTNASEGYPSGSFGRGAPGNAGGGGTDPKSQTNAANTGGGGGANYGRGGKGGDSWYDGFGRQPFGGLGGAPFPTSTRRLIMGGGGGGATSNNSTSGNVPSGGSGGGIVLVRAGAIAGSGSIEANGIAGVAPSNTDGGGAGGAGGTVLIQSVKNASSANVSISVQGGNGGNSGYRNHGPGGGGGGGYIAYEGLTPTAVSTNGGIPGNDVAGTGNGYGYIDPYEDGNPDPYGATAGESGKAETATIPAAGVSPGAKCLQPIVLLSKRITAIDSNGSTTRFSTVFDPASIPSDPSAANSFWPANYLQGGGVVDAGASPMDPTDAVPLKPGDEIEYTIYFLSAGKAQAEVVQLCDRIPTHQTFSPSAYNSLSAASGGSPEADHGIAVSYNGQYLGYTNGADGDTAQFIPAGFALPASCGSEPNISGAVVVNLGQGATSNASTNLGGTLPTADTSPATPSTSYGFVRFKAKVN